MKFSLPAWLCGPSLTLGLEPGGFCQINLDQNENCIRLLLEWTREMKPGNALLAQVREDVQNRTRRTRETAAMRRMVRETRRVKPAPKRRARDRVSR